MIKYTMNVQAGSLMSLSAGINAQVLPLLNQAVRAVAAATAANWQEAVLRAPGVWSGEKDAYAKSITWKMTGDFSATIETDYKYAAEIETGRPPKDLKKMLLTSPKVRRTTGGKRFLVIPMRQNTTGQTAHATAMPAGIYDLAKAMETSRVASVGERPSGEVTVLSPKTGMHAAAQQSPFLSNPKTRQAATVASRKYAWGGRLTAGAIKGAGFDQATVKRYAGMVKMPDGSGGHSYTTFRIMMEGSSGWVIGAKPGLYLAKKVADDMQPRAEKAFEMAVQKTLG
jgi:hypothetical protein